MGVIVPISAGTLASSCFADEQARLEAYAAVLTGQFPNDFTGVYTGFAAPTGSETLWARTVQPNPYPDNLYYKVSGVWYARHPLPPGVVVMWTGAVGDVATTDLQDDTQALEAVDSTHGPFWEVLSALAARFPIHPGTTSNGTVISAGSTGGEDEHTLTTAELPEHSHDLPVMGGDGVDNHGDFYEDAAGPANAYAAGFSTENAGSGDPHNNLPPYYGIYFIRRTARIYHRI